MKSGVDYFPLDVKMDTKFELIEAEFGLLGFAVVVKLFQRIYSEFGYYCEWTKEVALLFGKNAGVGGNAVSEIVSASIQRGIFDKGMYEKYGILTSSGIQKRYFEMVTRRGRVVVKNEYLLVQVTQNNIIVSNNGVIVSNNSKNDDNNPQSKVKESKVKEIKESDAPALFIPPTVEEVAAYCSAQGYGIDAGTFVSVYAAKGWMIGKNKMQDWKAQVDTWVHRRKSEPPVQSPRPAKKNSTNNYTGRKWDYDAMERQAQEQLDRQAGGSP